MPYFLKPLCDLTQVIKQIRYSRMMPASGQLSVPPGFRFHPTDEELLHYYLRKKVSYEAIDLDVIREIDLNKLEPWDLKGQLSLLRFTLCSRFVYHSEFVLDANLKVLKIESTLEHALCEDQMDTKFFVERLSCGLRNIVHLGLAWNRSRAMVWI